LTFQFTQIVREFFNSECGVKEIQATGEVLTARAGLGFVSEYIESQGWLMEMLQS
jgi:hypothetical protein